MTPAPTDHRREGRFTKGQVNRAGRLLLDLREEMDRLGPERALARFDEAELDAAWEALSWWRSMYARPLSNVAANLRYHAYKVAGDAPGAVAITQRLKRHATMIDKLAREPGDIARMQEIGGVRAVLPTLAQVYALRRRLLKSWTIVRERDYIVEPKVTGYRALHLIVRRAGYPIEVQLRTIGQDIWANTVEEEGRRIGLGVKFGAGGDDVQEVFRTMSELFARHDRDELSAAALIVALSNLRPLGAEKRAQRRSHEPR